MRYIFIFVFYGSLFCVFFPQVLAFSDVETSWYQQFIEEAQSQDFIAWYDDATFRPDLKISREEFLKILFQTSWEDIPDTYEENCFSDVDNTMWSKRYICFAQDIWVTQGYEDNTFRPYGTITSIEALAFIGRLYDFEIPQNQDEWFENYRIFFDERDIFEGHLFTKHTLLTRAQATELLMRAKYFSENKTFENISLACWTGITPQDSGTIEVAGKTRNYILSFPNGYTPEKSYSLIFGIHGRTNSHAMVQDYMKLERYPEWAIVVYPAWLWSWPYTWHQQENIEFFDALLAKISDNYCIKRDKVFVVGHSLGGYFTNKLWCLRWNVIRAISVVWWGSYRASCEYPVATQVLHRPDDHLVSYNQGEQMLRQFQEANLCSSETQSTSFWSIPHTRNICSAKNPTVFANSYQTFANDPHSWPKGGSSFAFEYFQSLK